MDQTSEPAPTSGARRAVAVGLAALLIATVIVVNLVDAARPDGFEGQRPYVTLYGGDRNQVEAVLVAGDGQAFGALAQDPTLARPDVIAAPGEYAYRAQRPLWGYLAWAVSGGQADLSGWALVALAIVACGLACGVVALLLIQRRANPWWALLTLAIGYESIGTLTPELFALALFGGGVLLWTRDRRGWAVAALCAAVLTRETMLVGVAAFALWQFTETDGSFSARVRPVVPLALPPLVMVAWDTLLRVRLGAWPSGSSESRLTAPGFGLIDSIVHRPSVGLALGALLAIAICVAAVALARHDALTWVAAGYGLFATTFAREVWVHAGFTRALLPLYVLGSVAVIGALQRQPATGRSLDRVPDEKQLTDVGVEDGT